MTTAPNDWVGANPSPSEAMHASSAFAEHDLTSDSPRPKVCLVTTEFHGLFKNGGIGTANTGLAFALTSAGFDVTVAFADADEKGPRVKQGDFFQLRAKYSQVGITLDFVPADPMVADGFNDGRSASYCVYLYLRKQNFCLVFFNDCGGQGYYSILAKYVGAFRNAPRMYVVAHGVQEWVLDINSTLWSKHSIITSYLERLSVELADVLISPSHYMVDWMTNLGWTLPASVEVIQNIVPVPKGLPSAPANNETPVSEIVFFGRLEVRKGLKLFCDAIDLLSQSVDLTNIRITFLGKFGYVAELHSGVYILERSRHWRSSSRILAKYGQEDALAYLSRAGVLAVIPSGVENSPCVVSECLQLGIPFLATAAGGTIELVAPEDQDRCLVAADPQLFAEKMADYLRNGQRLARLAISQEDVREEWLELSRSAVDDSAKTSGKDEDATGSLARKEPQTDEAPGCPVVSVLLADSNLFVGASPLIDSLLSQSYPKLEFLVTDNGVGANPDPRAALKSRTSRSSVRSLPGTFKDRNDARNAALAEAQGPYLLLVFDQNVFLTANCIQAMVAAAMRTNADIVTTFASEIMDSDEKSRGVGYRLNYIPVGACSELGAFENCFGAGVVLLSRESFRGKLPFRTPSFPEIDDWSFFVRSTLAGLHLEVVPEPLLRALTPHRPHGVYSRTVENQRVILSAYAEQKVYDFRHVLETIAQLNGRQGQNMPTKIAGLNEEAWKIAERLSSLYDPNSNDAFRGFIQFCIERRSIPEALEFALHNERSLLRDVVDEATGAAESKALDTIRQNALEVWHKIDLSSDVRDRIRSVSVFPAGDFERAPEALASHSLESGVRVLKAASVTPPSTRHLVAVAKVVAPGLVSADLAFVVSAPNARMRLSGQNLESTEPFWWSGWVKATESQEVELQVLLPQPAEGLLDLHFLSKTNEDVVHTEAKVIWESVSAILQIDGSVTSSVIEAEEEGEAISRQCLDRGELLTSHEDFPFPVYVPGDQTLLHPLPGRASLVRIKGAIPAGVEALRCRVSIQKAQAHPVQFAVWLKPPGNTRES